MLRSKNAIHANKRRGGCPGWCNFCCSRRLGRPKQTVAIMAAIPSALVIDDDSEALNAISQVLTSVGVQNVSAAGSAEEALEILKRRRFHLIVADYRLEGMDGVQFLEDVRASGDQTPLLLLSGAPDKSGIIRAINQPNVDVFGKPFRVAEFSAAINRLVCPGARTA